MTAFCWSVAGRYKKQAFSLRRSFIVSTLIVKSKKRFPFSPLLQRPLGQV